MIEVKLTFPTTDAAIAFLTARGACEGGPATGAANTAPTTAKGPKPGKSAQSTEQPAASSPTAAEATAPAAPAPSPESKPSAKTEAPTYEKSGIAEKIASYLGAKESTGYADRRSGLIALLKEFGAAKGPEIKPAQFDEFTARINALMQPEDALA